MARIYFVAIRTISQTFSKKVPIFCLKEKENIELAAANYLKKSARMSVNACVCVREISTQTPPCLEEVILLFSRSYFDCIFSAD